MGLPPQPCVGALVPDFLQGARAELVPEQSRVPGQDGATPPGRGSPRQDDITVNRMRPSLLSARRERGRESKKGRKKENFWKSLRFLCSSLLFGRQLPSPLPSSSPPPPHPASKCQPMIFK